MYDNDSKGFSYTGGFFMLIAFAIAGLIAASMISIPVWQAMTGKSFQEMPTAMLDPAYSHVMKLMQAITALVGFLLPTLLVAALINRRPLKLLGFNGSGNPEQLGLTVLIIGAGLLFASSLSYLTHQLPISVSWQARFEQMEADYARQVSAILGLRSFGDYLLALVIMAFLPALCEEAIFRGGLQNMLARGTGKPIFAVIVVSILFSLAHISYYGFLSRLALGIILGLLYYYSGRLWISILAHFINNAVALTVLYVYTRQGRPLQEAMADEVTSLWGLLALPALVMLFIAFKKAGRKPKYSY